MLSKHGALPDHLIKGMIENGSIVRADKSSISPASLDLSVSEEIYRLRGVMQPRVNESVYDLLKFGGAQKHSLRYPLEPGVIYLCKLNERLSLPNNIYGYCNPKSTTGRNDVHVRVVANGVTAFDTIPKNYDADIWALIVPKSIPSKIGIDEKITQLRLFDGDTRISEAELSVYMDQYKFLWDKEGNPIKYKDVETRDGDGSLFLGVDLSDEIIGYKYIRSGNVLDFSKGKKSHKKEDFFEPIYGGKDYIHLEKNGFYILPTLQNIRVPPFFACEMRPVDERMGDFRSHYAGFFDPGWGWGKNGEGKGRSITLEIRSFEEDLILRHGQPVGKVKYERVIGEPEVHYDQKDTSNYKVQNGAKLSKHFY